LEGRVLLTGLSPRVRDGSLGKWMTVGWKLLLVSA
jgi:hypothetical protein